MTNSFQVLIEKAEQWAEEIERDLLKESKIIKRKREFNQPFKTLRRDQNK